MLRMPGVAAASIDLTSLPAEAAALIARLQQQAQAHAQELARRDREIKFKDAKIERITFELARLKAWKFGAKTEAMNAEQRQMFEDTLAEDEADLEAQLEALQGDVAEADKPQGLPSASHAARRCPSTCAASSTTTSPRTPPARRRTAARPWCASART